MDDDRCPQDISDFLSDLSNFAEIDIHINSGGGDVFGGIAIYNILKNHSGSKTVYIDGLAASIASVIALCGDRVVMRSGAQFMIHKPWSRCVGDSDDMLKTAELLEKIQNNILDIYMDHVQDGVTREDIEAMVNAETWMNGTEAAKYFRMEVETAAAAACASGCFGNYRNTPKSLTEQKPTTEQDVTLLQLELELLMM
jgi:ATP-dependent protease ClpP protease subunit